MSKEPGRVETAIEAAFASDPDGYFICDQYTTIAGGERAVIREPHPVHGQRAY